MIISPPPLVLVLLMVISPPPLALVLPPPPSLPRLLFTNLPAGRPRGKQAVPEPEAHGTQQAGQCDPVCLRSSLAQRKH